MYFFYHYYVLMITEHFPKPVLIHNLGQSYPDLRWRDPIQAVNEGVLAVYEDKDKRYNVIKIDQEGKIERDQEGEIINKLYVTDKPFTGLIWEDPDLYVLFDGGDIVHVREEGVIKQHHIKHVTGELYGGAVEKFDILIVDHTGGRIISYNVQSGHKEIKLQGLHDPRCITKTVYDNQVLYIITEHWGQYHITSLYYV